MSRSISRRFVSMLFTVAVIRWNKMRGFVDVVSPHCTLKGRPADPRTQDTRVRRYQGTLLHKDAQRN